MPYRIEFSPNNRAGCKSPVCKPTGVKIQKGQVRLGVWVMGPNFESWSYRHWGCVTPKQIENLKEFVEDNLEELLEGFTDLNEEWQDRVRKALEDGHVDDDDWLGDPAYNRAGKSGMTPRKRKAVEQPADDSDPASPSSSHVKSQEEDTPVKKKPAKKAKPEKQVKPELNEDTEPPPKKSRTKKVKPEPKENIKSNQVKLEANDTMDLDIAPATKSRAKKVKVEATEEADTEPPPKKSRGKKVKKEELPPATKNPVTTRSGRRTKAPNYRE